MNAPVGTRTGTLLVLLGGVMGLLIPHDVPRLHQGGMIALALLVAILGVLVAWGTRRRECGNRDPYSPRRCDRRLGHSGSCDDSTLPLGETVRGPKNWDLDREVWTRADQIQEETEQDADRPNPF